MHEALFWKETNDGQVRCDLCRFRCLIAKGRLGRCKVRQNRGGKLYSLVYGHCIAEQIDPIEKKPLFHYHPGSLSYSIATVGCNFHCLHCQNHTLSQWPAERPIAGQQLTPKELVQRAAASECRSIAYTYTEPTIYYEYAYDCAVLAHQQGLGNVFVSNGYTTPEALEHIAPYLDAANIDLKSFSAETYKKLTGAELQGVLETLQQYHQLGIWLEVTTLLIPGCNDSDEELRAIANFIAGQLGCDTPWHVTAFHPAYRMADFPRTPLATLQRARSIGAAAGLHYIYEGNLPGSWENTVCPACGKGVIERDTFQLTGRHLADGCCAHCQTSIAGIGL
jgi:pyruvate formate lyase activating enzyme